MSKVAHVPLFFNVGNICLNERHHDLSFFLSTLNIIFSSQPKFSFLPHYKDVVRNETGEK